jgi:ubiquitin-protein ligase
VYHPNISKEGGICTLGIEKDWVPTRTAPFVIDFVLTMFRNPSEENP